MKGDFLNFENFNVWKHGRVLVLEIYKITKNFPKDELFSLKNQMRRSSDL
ncbi:MAG TPA: four helix bundle protein [bacterium]|nr:four helix bundle protein [bacterium]